MQEIKDAVIVFSLHEFQEMTDGIPNKAEPVNALLWVGWEKNKFFSFNN